MLMQTSWSAGSPGRSTCLMRGAFSDFFQFSVGLTFIRSVGLSILLAVRRSDVKAICDTWAFSHPKDAPRNPNCASATTYTIWVIGIGNAVYFFLSIYFYYCIEAYQYRLEVDKVYTRIGVKSVAPPVLPTSSNAPLAAHAAPIGTTDTRVSLDGEGNAWEKIDLPPASMEK
ncbi:hypothetical protein BDK51DRAFT_41643 [Blyttiomyces helicus]|uniref:Uncharacterized protein n=1 Tax=Blyttiomyces helicus TaxID=388810 RepID=A0A4P9WGJ8_9FUNG|nr:hypothetical protein BDK51DRAFT_41643 [Blyttiomyces helicus]|eukprot:RKO90498.1 hypothetical protein BDK51DRAFT_41643 [Blyttiomyces helicus]